MFISAPPIIRAAVRSATRIQLTSDKKTSGPRRRESLPAAHQVRAVLCIELPARYFPVSDFAGG